MEPLITSYDSFKALDVWFKYLLKYDDSYDREMLLNYKAKKIQQKAISNNNKISTPDFPKGYMSISENFFEDEENSFFIGQAYAIQLQSQFLQNNNNDKIDLYKSLENLSERIYDFFDDEDDIEFVNYIV